jgi:transposase
MGTGRPKAVLSLTPEEREVLQGYARRHTSAQMISTRARIVLACATGLSNVAVAKEVGVHHNIVGKWRRRFLEDRLDGLFDEPRPGVPRKISDRKVEQVVTLTLESTPKHATHWSTRDMARKVGLSRMSVSRIWKAFRLAPHRSETFKLSKDPMLVEKVRDIVGLYLNPPDKAVVLCFDEKGGIQALDRTQPLLPMRPGQIERRTPDYVRHGTSSLFAALDVATGKVIGRCVRRQRSIEFKKFLGTIDEAVPKELEVHVVLDNYRTHKTPAIQTWARKHPRFHFHFTPTGGSWINQVERFFAELTRRQLKRGVHRSTAELEKAIRQYIEESNRTAKPFIWTKSAQQILDSMQRFCLRTLAAHKPTLITRISGTGH